MPDRYTIAQTLDHKAGLCDLLSTAFFYQSDERRQVTPAALWGFQQASAERASASLDVSALLPWKAPRWAFAAAGLTVALAALMLLRYGVTGSLDMRAPVVAGLNTFFGSSKEQPKYSSNGKKKPGDPPIGVTVDDPSQDQKNLDAAPDDILTETLTPDVNNSTDPFDSVKAQRREVKAAGAEGDGMEEAEDGESTSADNADSKSGPQDGNAPGLNKDGKQQAQNNQQTGKEGSQSSMMDKMRDAMANLLAKLKLPNAGQKTAQQAQKGAQGGGETKGKQSAQNNKGSPSGKGTPSEDAEGADEGEAGDQAQSGQGKGSDNGNDQQSPASSQSGMGKQDGAKEIKDAEQLAAMGKLSEIYGKRAQNLTGEIMVEVTSSKQQQLRTGYSRRETLHRDAGGQIQRDEVPLDLQHYVRQYFEQVRQPPVPSKP